MQSPWNMRTLAGLLLADTTKMFFDVMGIKMRGNTLRFQAQYLRLLPVPRYDMLSAAIREGLAHAFDANDRTGATDWAMQAYENAFAALGKSSPFSATKP